MNKYINMVIKTLTMRLMLLLLIPAAMASNMIIDISLDSNGLVTENITIFPDAGYDSVSYDPGQLPLTVLYKGEYSIDGTSLSFTYDDEVNFVLVFDELAHRNFGRNSFRTSFQPGVDSYEVRLALPQHAILDTEPAVVPAPDSIETDGRNIIIYWSFEGDSSLSVFYRETSRNYLPLALLVIAIIFCAIFIGRYILRKRIDDILSDDEKAVLDLIKKKSRQDHIAKELNFSKSKMSKVVRKLEEKGLVKKEPYFKTNILKR